ncbi:hypothetical protein NliqN6_4692 [Naganishia liquefaciens]|uniref:Uncharacterized protein n=1 Tax=Naganishia liquefaciens TaxID=104408 RepID=A0A8H3TWW6_9TREE|nr:hypothetical protein NliqN6_4692 [Naganishia liquefaciens]
MTLLHILSYAGAIATFLFVTLSLASGLLWLAELIEEHSKTAKTVGIRAIYCIIALHILLYLIDGLPLLLILFSIAAHIVYLQNFTSTWPFLSLTSARFLGSCVMVVADHFLWFFYFAEKAQEAKRWNGSAKRFRQQAGGSAGKQGPTFMDVAAFFAVCVWFVPLFLFLSLSANDNVLPQMDQAPGTPSGLGRTVDLSSSPHRPHLSLDIQSGKGYDYLSSQSHPHTTTSRGPTSLVKSLLAPVLALVPGARRTSRGRQHDEGIIAPRTPLKGSPLPSPRLSGMTLSAQQSHQGSSGTYSPWGEGSGSGNGSYATPARDGGVSPASGPGLLAAPGQAGTPSIAQRRGSPRRIASSSSLSAAAAAAAGGIQLPPLGSPVGGPPRRVPSEVRVSSMAASSRVSEEGMGGALGVAIGGREERAEGAGLTSRRTGRKDD